LAKRPTSLDLPGHEHAYRDKKPQSRPGDRADLASRLSHGRARAEEHSRQATQEQQPNRDGKFEHFLLAQARAGRFTTIAKGGEPRRIQADPHCPWVTYPIRTVNASDRKLCNIDPEI